VLINSNTALGTGPLTVTDGEICQLTAGGEGGRTLSNAVILGKGITVYAGNDLTFSSGTVDLGNAANLFDISNLTTFGGVISNGAGSGVGSIDKRGAGTLILAGANTYSGGTTLNAGILGIGIDSVVSGKQILSGALGTGPLTVATGNIQAAGGHRTLANNMVINNRLTADGAWNLTLNGDISGTGALVEDKC